MQEIVSYLIQHPEVLEQIIKGNASLIGLDQDQILSIVEGFKEWESIGRRVPVWG
ncbi:MULTISPECIES: competence pheromone ComX [Bacillus]|uniref:competence pheromone ComX n=1 Tax=Bacillus TaxID=1386 RepID=UPI00047EA201|nr:MULTISPECIES: competence pheromone ComX [Bacillus]QHZ45775.1 competence pheromone ComX [Bacillus sp. NSP9.1]WFA04362.1 competence pheromone ComX [Bacillus sp. HSf4]